MLIGVTMGDASGVGPEILLKAWHNGELATGTIIVFGDLAILEHANRLLHLRVPLRSADGTGDWRPGHLNVIDAGLLCAEDLRIGVVDQRSGAAARAYVVAATQAALAGKIAAIVTLPMNKEATQLSDATFTGHTELIAELCGVSRYAMMLSSEQLSVTHVSTHVSMAEAVRRVKKERILALLDLTHDAMTLLVDEPRIAVAGLNPHAGEHGLFGMEELTEIAPAVEEARSKGLQVEGPIPPDTVFYQAVRRKRYDAVVCMYHDQGHIPMKLLDFEGGVNITLGLPIIRTSVDHGTAFDIAYQSVASTRSFISALRFAERMAERRPQA